MSSSTGSIDLSSLCVQTSKVTIQARPSTVGTANQRGAWLSSRPPSSGQVRERMGTDRGGKVSNRGIRSTYSSPSIGIGHISSGITVGSQSTRTSPAARHGHAAGSETSADIRAARLPKKERVSIQGGSSGGTDNGRGVPLVRPATTDVPLRRSQPTTPAVSTGSRGSTNDKETSEVTLSTTSTGTKLKGISTTTTTTTTTRTGSVRRIPSGKGNGKGKGKVRGTFHSNSSKGRNGKVKPKGASTVEKAALAIAQADYVLIAAGAGLSADSGLPVYKDIALVPVYNDEDLTYADLCDPELLLTKPALFYGFWGECFNAYMRTTPHDGYTMLRQMVEREKIPRRRRKGDAKTKDHSTTTTTTTTTTATSNRRTIPRYFVYTSNVDTAFVRAGFAPAQVCEIHGNIVKWQCGEERRCSDNIWHLPLNGHFDVNPDSRRYYMQSALGDGKGAGGEVKGHHRCRSCGGKARPNILMFDDDGWVDECLETDYDIWRQRVVRAVKRDPTLSVAIIEMGAGTRIPTVRQNSVALARKLGRSATLIRINPDFPSVPRSVPNSISFKANALETIQALFTEVVKLYDPKGE